MAGGGRRLWGTPTPPVGEATGLDGQETVHLSPQAIQALDLAPDEVAEEEQLEEEVPRQVAIGKRLGDWRTLLSFGIAAAILVVAVGKAGINWGTALHTLRHANLALFGLAVVVYYASFPIRTYRWRSLMRNANHGALQHKIARFPLRDLTQILYLSWFANVVIPAKLGDVYRAYLARRWLGVSLSRTVGTILAERILDLVVLFPLLLVSAFLTFQAKLLSTHDSKITYALGVGLIAPGKVGPMAALFLALGSSVLTTLPLTPGGLGFVEPFIFTVLALLGVAGGISTGAAVAVLDRIISYLSIAVIGFFLYALTDKAHVAPAASPPGTATAR